MMWPTLIVDNFFDDPKKVINFSKQLTYERDKEHRWPGTRTKPLHEINKEFFRWSTKKIMTLLFPMNIKDFADSKSIMGLNECVKNNVLEPYDVYCTRKGDYIAK